jgi:transposase-like protein
VIIKRNRTHSKYIYYALYFYFSGLSLRRASKILSSYFIKRNHVSVWNWIQKYHPNKIVTKRKRVSEYIVDETLLKVGSELYLVMGCNRAYKQANLLTINF